MLKLSTIVSDIMARPSRMHNLAYLLFGYAIASTVISVTQTESLSDYILLIGITGGFVGTFMFYIKPIEKLLLIILRLRLNLKKIPFDSPFLIETKGKIIGGIYFSLICFIIISNPNLRKLILENPWLPAFLAMACSIIFCISLYEALKLPKKIEIVNYYYNHITDEISVVIALLKGALERGDWIEANAMYEKARA